MAKVLKPPDAGRSFSLPRWVPSALGPFLAESSLRKAGDADLLAAADWMRALCLETPPKATISVRTGGLEAEGQERRSGSGPRGKNGGESRGDDQESPRKGDQKGRLKWEDKPGGDRLRADGWGGQPGSRQKAESQKKGPICAFYLKGNCYKLECTFRHDRGERLKGLKQGTIRSLKKENGSLVACIKQPGLRATVSAQDRFFSTEIRELGELKEGQTVGFRDDIEEGGRRSVRLMEPLDFSPEMAKMKATLLEVYFHKQNCYLLERECPLGRIPARDELVKMLDHRRTEYAACVNDVVLFAKVENQCSLCASHDAQAALAQSFGAQANEELFLLEYNGLLLDLGSQGVSQDPRGGIVLEGGRNTAWEIGRDRERLHERLFGEIRERKEELERYLEKEFDSTQEKSRFLERRMKQKYFQQNKEPPVSFERSTQLVRKLESTTKWGLPTSKGQKCREGKKDLFKGALEEAERSAKALEEEKNTPSCEKKLPRLSEDPCGKERNEGDMETEPSRESATKYARMKEREELLGEGEGPPEEKRVPISSVGCSPKTQVRADPLISDAERSIQRESSRGRLQEESGSPVRGAGTGSSQEGTIDQQGSKGEPAKETPSSGREDSLEGSRRVSSTCHFYIGDAESLMQQEALHLDSDLRVPSLSCEDQAQERENLQKGILSLEVQKTEDSPERGFRAPPGLDLEDRIE